MTTIAAVTTVGRGRVPPSVNSEKFFRVPSFIIVRNNIIQHNARNASRSFMAFGTSSKTTWSGKRCLLLFRRSRVVLCSHNSVRTVQKTHVSSDIRFVVDYGRRSQFKFILYYYCYYHLPRTPFRKRSEAYHKESPRRR